MISWMELRLISHVRLIIQICLVKAQQWRQSIKGSLLSSMYLLLPLTNDAPI